VLTLNVDIDTPDHGSRCHAMEARHIEVLSSSIRQATPLLIAFPQTLHRPLNIHSKPFDGNWEGILDSTSLKTEDGTKYGAYALTRIEVATHLSEQ
jgi:hypothetical protein